MAQHEKCFAGSVLQGSCVLAWIAVGQLCILRRKQSQPPAYFAALLVNRIVGASATPAVSNLKPLPHFTDSVWELRGQPRLPGPKNRFGHFWRHFFGTAKIQKFWANFEKNAGLPNSAAILRHSAAFCGNSAEAGPTRRFWFRKVHFLASKKSKKGRFWQKNLRVYFGFSAAILRKILKGQNPSPNGPDCIFEPSQRASEVLQALSPLTATNPFFSCRLVKFWCCHTHPTTENNSNCVFWSELMRVCGRFVFFCPFDGGQVRDVRNKCCVFLEPWKWLRSSVLVSETRGNIACC